MTKFCCEDLKRHVEHKCDVHSNAFDCFDHIIYYDKIVDEYGIIIHDGGSSCITISFCPFCGVKLPESKSELYFNILEKLGFNGRSSNLPQEFLTDEWWKKRGL